MDGEMEDEIAASIAPLARGARPPQEDALFSGEYDAGDALVTIHAGTGGTDAQDWAEILLRMYLRWAQNRGFQTELLEASPGEEAGLKSATFSVSGENAYGILKAERGVHRLVRLSPVRPGAPPPHELRAGDRQPAAARRRRRRDRRERPADRHLPRQRRRRPAREQDRLGGPDHAPPDRDRRPDARTSARRARTSRPRCAILKSRLLEQEQERREEELAKERGAAQDAGFGSQIRSYVLHPYQLVKDHRTDYETGNTQAVLDGDLDEFVHEYLLARAAGKVVLATAFQLGFAAVAQPAHLAPASRPSPPVQEPDFQHRRPRTAVLDHEPVSAAACALELGDGHVRERDEDLRAGRRRAPRRLLRDRQGRVRLHRRRLRLGQVDGHPPVAEGARADAGPDRRRRPRPRRASSARRCRCCGATSAASSRTSSCCRTAPRPRTSPTRSRCRARTRTSIRRKVPEVLNLVGLAHKMIVAARRALRRRAAARLDRARLRQPPAAPDLRRADRQPRSRHVASGSCSCSTGSTAPARRS